MTGFGKPGQKTWDKVFYVVVNVVFLAWLVLMPLDAVRFQSEGGEIGENLGLDKITHPI
jgi:hypothetical protein